MNRFLLTAVDFVVLTGLSFVAFFCRFGGITGEVIEYAEHTRFLKSLPFYVVFVLTYLAARREYSVFSWRTLGQRAGLAAEAVLLGTGLVVLSLLAGNDREFSRLLLFYQGLLSFSGLILVRIVDDRLRKTRMKGCLVTDGSMQDSLEKCLPGRMERLDWSTNPSWDEVGRSGADFVVIPYSLARSAGPGFLEEIYRYVKIPVLFFLERESAPLLAGSPALFAGRPVFLVSPDARTGTTIVKRTMDIILSVILLVLSFPFLILIFLAIRVSGYGSAIFIQERVGQFGKLFRIYKFRTMKEGEKGPSLTEKNDPRITPLGRILRRFSLDELPQLFNILKGEMSFVGPRPEIPEIVESYNEWKKKVLSVKPGLTGLAQVSGRDDLSLDEKIVLDIYYVHNYSLWLDISIILRTFVTVLAGTGVRY